MIKQRLKLLKSVVLVGLMGAGKSTIGDRLARRLNLPFLDTDVLIQEKVGCPIAEIVKYVGEDFFKEKEKEVVADVLQREPCVISTGGSAFLSKENREIIKQKAISVWLKADYSVILDRVSRKNTRPTLENGNKAEIVRKLMDESYPIYAEADISIKSDDGSHMIIVESIVDSLIKMEINN